MELFTNLTRLKMAMNGGHLPPMTAVTKEAQNIIDPAFTPGMGALEEHMDRGLRCPVRGCGEYYHYLAQHLSKAHANIGGPSAVKRVLDIAPRTPLSSNKARAAMRRSLKKRDMSEATARLQKVGRHLNRRARRESARGISQARKSVGFRNLLDRCEAQLKHKLIDLENKIGRSPNSNEARAEYGAGFVGYVVRAYGSWNSAKLQFGLTAIARGGQRVAREAVLEGLQAWYDAHGDLPTLSEAKARDRAPLLVHGLAAMRSLGTNSWPEAMQRAAAILNIYGGRYGLPESARPKKRKAS